MFEIILRMKRYVKCEIKTASRRQQVTVNKRVIAIEPNHLNGWFIQQWNTIMLLRHKTVLWLGLEWFLLAKWSKSRKYVCLKY